MDLLDTSEFRKDVEVRAAELDNDTNQLVLLGTSKSNKKAATVAAAATKNEVIVEKKRKLTKKERKKLEKVLERKSKTLKVVS
jgi:hypothetical protein